MRSIVTGRDPRDIYISLAQRVAAGKAGWRDPVTPERVAAHLNAQYALQCEVEEAVPSVRVRYEDLCMDPEATLAHVRRHIGLPQNMTGSVGDSLLKIPQRATEWDLHGRQVTNVRVARWRREPDRQLAAEASQCMNLMDDYAEAWGYS